MQKETFKRTLTIAQQPASILQHVKDGTLQPQDLKDFVSMYPEHYQSLEKQLLTALNDHISRGETIPYKTRMGLSLFLGTPVDSSFTPSSIMAAQMAGKQQAQAPQQQPKVKHASAKLGDKTNNMYKTPEQAAETDRSARE